jgi:hypothetical protein
MEEFEISRDIKGDFCEFSSKRIDQLFQEIDQKWLETKNEVT